jgi:GT2 family glycosyltransferase
MNSMPHADTDQPTSPLDPSGDVSVVIVTYKSPEVLDDCLASFERHRPRRVGEVVVVDNSVEVEGTPLHHSFPWITYVANAENVHFRRGVNQGVAAARLRYVFILNPDTHLTDPDSIGKLAEVLDRDSSIGFVGPMMRGDDGRLAPQGERTAGLLHLLATKTYLHAAWPRNPVARWHSRSSASRDVSAAVETVSAGALLCRREQFLAVGGFDERATIYWEEHELARKLRRRGLHGYYRADAFVFHRWRQGGTQHDGAVASQRYFDEAMRNYYGMFYGRGGTLLFDALERLQRLVRRARG